MQVAEALASTVAGRMSALDSFKWLGGLQSGITVPRILTHLLTASSAV